MHASIFQISTKPISGKEFSSTEDFYEEHGFADYIGDRYECEEREQRIEWLADTLNPMFERDGDTFIYKGIGTFIRDWNIHVRKLANSLRDTDFNTSLRYKIESCMERTHLDLDDRFYIEEWNRYAGPFTDLIDFTRKLKEGDRLYVGAVIDFHY